MSSSIPGSIPDGGWGWAIVLGASMINLSTRSIEPSFGLLFGDLLNELNVGTTGAAVIMSTLDAMINFSGLFVGPLVKKLSYRKVAVLGGFLSAVALISTSFAHSMTHIILTYGILGGLGFGLATASSFVGLNSYFLRRRGQAVGLAMAGTALGFMAMPQIVSVLLQHYDFQGTLILLGGISLHSFIGATLFQPVKWHLKTNVPPRINEEVLQTGKARKENALMCESLLSDEDIERKDSVVSFQGLNGIPNGFQRQLSVTSGMNRQGSFTEVLKRQLSESNRIPRVTSAGSLKRKMSVISHVSHLDFTGSAMHIDFASEGKEEDNGLEINFKKIPSEKGDNDSPSCWQRLSDLMDFNLLKDGVYLNILYGTSIAYVAELNFKMVVPFFMANLGYSKEQTAMALSAMAISDIAARVLVPPIFDRLPYSKRYNLMIGCVFVAITRSLLAMQTTTAPLMTFLILHGFFRGMTLINFPLVLSEYATMENFPSVLGLSMVAKAIFIAFFGPFVGFIRDYTQSYPICIHTQSVMIATCVIAWSIEFILKKRRSTAKENENVKT